MLGTWSGARERIRNGGFGYAVMTLAGLLVVAGWFVKAQLCVAGRSLANAWPVLGRLVLFFSLPFLSFLTRDG